MTRALAVLLALAVVVVAGVLAPRSSGAAHSRYKLAFAIHPKDPRWPGIRRADKRIGIRSVLLNDYDVADLVAGHVDAVVGDGYDPTLKPFFAKARKAGIAVLSSGDDIAAKPDLWVNYSSATDFGHAMADALASQIQGQGEYAILEEQDMYPIGHTWEQIVQAYIPQAYPNMKLDGVLDLTGAGDQAEIDSIKSFMSNHPNLKGLISIAPTEAYNAAEAITEAGKIGDVFAAGNGGSWLRGTAMVGYVKSGATEDVMGGDPLKLGYLTVWAAHYLLAGHHFKNGTYRLAQWGLRVSYHPEQRELRLGRPLTITNDNLFLYTGSTSAHAAQRVALKATTVQVSTHNSRYVLSAKSAPRGVVIFKVTNPASQPHDFSINGRTSKLLRTGQSATLRVDFRRKGRYSYRDTFDHHAQFGCRGGFKIT